MHPLALAALVLALPVAHLTDVACEGIRPGAAQSTPFPCTLNFVYADADGALYVGTAGHCVHAPGTRVGARGVGEFGTVVFRQAAGDFGDFGLVRVDEEKRHLVNPRVCALPGPTAAEPEDPSPGDPVVMYGQGVVVGETPATRARAGVLTGWYDVVWKAVVPVVPLDSGAPVVTPAGEAVGHVTHVSGGFVFRGTPDPGKLPSIAGPRVAASVALAEAATGLDLELVTAP